MIKTEYLVFSVLGQNSKIQIIQINLSTMVSLNTCGCIWCQNLTTSDICAYLLISQSLTDSDSHKSDQTEIWTLKAAHRARVNAEKCDIFFCRLRKITSHSFDGCTGGLMKYYKKNFTLHFNRGPLNAKQFFDCFYFFDIYPWWVGKSIFSGPSLLSKNQ